MEGFRIFNDSQLDTVINKGKTAVTCFQLDSVRAAADGNFTESDRLQLLATSLLMKIDQLENSTSMTDEQKSNLAQGIISEGELYKIEKTYDYASCTGVVSSGSTLGLPIDHLTDIVNVGSYTHAQIDGHINNRSNPHEVDLSAVLSEEGITGSKGDILSFDADGNPAVAGISYGGVLLSNSLAETGLTWGVVTPSNHELYPGYSALVRKSSTDGVATYLTFPANSVMGRLSGNLTTVSILDEDNMTSNSATSLVTQQSVRAFVENKLSSDGYRVFVVNNGGEGEWYEVSTSSVFGRSSTGFTNWGVLDQDTMVSNSSTSLATQQSIKSYSDGYIGGVPVSSTVSSPTAGNDQYVLSYDHSSQSYILRVNPGSLWTEYDTGKIYYIGNVGIGSSSTNPEAGLDATGGAIFNKDQSSVDFRVSSSGSGHMFFVDGSQDKIGINYQNPTEMLHMYQGNIKITNVSSDAPIKIQRLSAVVNDRQGILHNFNNISGTESSYASFDSVIKSSGAGSHDGAISLRVAENGTLVERVEIQGSEVAFKNVDAINLRNTDSGTTASESINYYINDTGGNNQLVNAISFTISDRTNGSEDSSTSFSVTQNGSLTSYFTLDGTIGAPKVQKPLLLYSATNTTNAESAVQTPTNGMVFYNSGSNQFQGRANGTWIPLGGFTGTTGSIPFVQSGGSGQPLTQDNTNLFWDNSNKRLGINSSAPSVALTVIGDGYFSGDITWLSDEKHKKDVEPIYNALDGVLKLRGVDFTRIDTDEESTGFIAQEVEKVFPRLVKKQGEDLTVKYANFAGIFAEAIKELNSEILNLKEQIKELKDGITD